MNFKFQFSLLIFFSLLLPGLKAQSLSDTLNISEVSVTSGRNNDLPGMNKIRVDSLSMVLHGSDNLGELLSVSTPVYIKSAGPGTSSGASIRGTSSSHTLVFWEGVDLNSPMRGDVDLSLLPVSFSDQVEILYGGASLASGSGGLGGTILLENAADWNRSFGTALSYEAGSFGSYGNRFELSGGRGKWWGRIRTSAYQSANNYVFYNYALSPGRKDTLENSPFSSYSSMQEWYLRLGKGIISLKAKELVSERELPPLLTNMDNEEKTEQQNDLSLSTILNYRLYGEKSRFSISSGINYQAIRYYLSLGVDQISLERIVNSDSYGKEQSYFASVDYSRALQRNLEAKVAYRANYNQVAIFDSSLYVFTGYGVGRAEQSVLASLSYKPSSHFSAYFLNRGEWVGNRLVPLIPSIGFETVPFSTIPCYLKASVSRNYRFPALNDLYWVPGGNPDLLPEHGSAFETTAGYTSNLSGNGKNSGDQLQLSLTAYYLVIHDWIEWRPGSRAYYWEPANIGLVHSRGLEAFLAYNKKLNEKYSLKINANYSLTRASNESVQSAIDNSKGEQLIYIPLHKGGLSGELRRGSLWFSISLPYTGEIHTSSSISRDDEAYLPEASYMERIIQPVLLLHMSIGGTWKAGSGKLKLELSCRNVLDTPYTAVLYRPMPGRWLNLRLQYYFEKGKDE